MRTSRGAMALVRTRRGGGSFWLTRWNESWGAFHLVGGHLAPGEGYREALTREIAEELGLRNLVDYIVSPRPTAHLGYNAWSRSAGVETRYETELFEVWLTDDARRSLDGNPSVRWIGEDEIRLGRCDDPCGRPVSPTLALLLARVGLIEPPGADGPDPVP